MQQTFSEDLINFVNYCWFTISPRVSPASSSTTPQELTVQLDNPLDIAGIPNNHTLLLQTDTETISTYTISDNPKLNVKPSVHDSDHIVFSLLPSTFTTQSLFRVSYSYFCLQIYTSRSKKIEHMYLVDNPQQFIQRRQYKRQPAGYNPPYIFSRPCPVGETPSGEDSLIAAFSFKPTFLNPGQMYYISLLPDTYRTVFHGAARDEQEQCQKLFISMPHLPGDWKPSPHQISDDTLLELSLPSYDGYLGNASNLIPPPTFFPSTSPPTPTDSTSPT